MSKEIQLFSIIAALALMVASAAAQDASAMDHSQMSAMSHEQMNNCAPDDEMSATMPSMSHKHMDMGPHMKMTAPRPPNAADQRRADNIVNELRNAIEKYQDVSLAEQDGFKEFLPNVPSPMKHFTNRRYAIEAQFHFNPDHPTSLLYEKHGSTYKLIGAMYTAPKRYKEDDLNKRVPLSVAQWHEHVNLCRAPEGEESQYFGSHPQFGLNGSIASKGECEAAGGKFYPIVFNWMVHVYPFEKNPADVWSLERQMPGHAHMD